MASRICWHCGQAAYQEMIYDPVRQKPPLPEPVTWFAAYTCAQCGFMSIGLADHLRNAGLSSVRSRMDADRAEIRWLPEKGIWRAFPDAPAHVAGAAGEAYACQSVGAHRAAILLARSVIEALAKDQGVTTGSLASKIDALYEKRLIGDILQQSAHEIRFVGNDMAHGDYTEPVSTDTAEEVLTFMSEMVDEVYGRPARLARHRAKRTGGSEAGPLE